MEFFHKELVKHSNVRGGASECLRKRTWGVTGVSLAPSRHVIASSTTYRPAQNEPVVDELSP